MSEEYDCDECGMSFTSKKKYEDHLREKHPSIASALGLDKKKNKDIIP